MSKHPVVFIALRQFDNLGIGYLASLLSEAGYDIQIIDLTGNKDRILKTLKRIKPLIVGFSVIFQYHIHEFKNLISYLRKGGIKCHFTAGGYYASLRYEELFKIIPSLDSVVRFDGEYTFLELVSCIHNGADWHKIKSIAFKNSDIVKVIPVRPNDKDLDKFPFPLRTPLKEYALGKKFATIIAGRGCVNNCSFCNNREFNRQSSGPIKRTRKPEKVVEEMEFLHRKMNCSVFLFQDDDFPVKTNKGSEWIEVFCKELKRKKLNNKIMWKINCRPDEIDFDSFVMMKNHGLYLVFLGIDDGTDRGLIHLNKQMTVAKSLEGIDILKRLNIGFDYGFLLFQPTITFRSLNDNLDFLKQICGDGHTPVSFLKLRPYFDTQVEKELEKEGRLKGKPGFLDYDFLDDSLNHYYEFVTDCFMEWLRDPDGLVNRSRWARNYISVFSFFDKTTPEFYIIADSAKRIIANSNLLLLGTLKDLALQFEHEQFDKNKYSNLLKNYKKEIRLKHENFKEQVYNLIEELVYISEPALKLFNYIK